MEKQRIDVSPWAVHLANQLAGEHLSILSNERLFSKEVRVVLTVDSAAIYIDLGGGVKLTFRLAFTPAADLVVADRSIVDRTLQIKLISSLGTYRVAVELKEDESIASLHYVVYFTPAEDVKIPFWPKDVVALREGGLWTDNDARVHVVQKGLRSGLVYVSWAEPVAGAMLYFQNLTAMSDYCAATGTSVADAVSGQWPEFGFALPPSTEKPIRKGREYAIADAFAVFAEEAPTDQFEIAKQFMDMLAYAYLLLPKPAVMYHDYPEIATKALRELANHKGCWTHHRGHNYLNAYVCDYKTPPEIMVQLAVLLPLKEYEEWREETIPMIAELEAGLTAFYDDDIGTVQRWLPAAEQQLDGEEEQKKPLIMDSWYLHHPLLNLSRMALQGHKIAEKLFLRSLDYAVKVAHHFNYKWPVFYKMDTLETVKAETKPGEGGEKDVAGIYAHVMMQAWDLTGDDTYLNEAKKAAKSLVSDGFKLFYQANNTAFAAGAMLRLWKATKDELYLDLGYLFIANVFRNVALWDSWYGHGVHFPLFFAVFPLSDAPYTAVYEEVEVFSAIHEFLEQADEVPIPRAFALLLAEFIRYALHRMVYYYPTVLPGHMLADDVKTGEVDRKLWVPLEDIYPEWEKSGTVGQEVYGAGFPFAIVSRHFFRIADEAYMLFVNYPVSGLVIERERVSVKVLGDERLSCKLYVVKLANSESLEITVSGERQAAIEPQAVDDLVRCYDVWGDQHVVLHW